MIDVVMSKPVASTRIKVFGIGGAGGNAVKRMVSYGMKGVEFYALNTDMQVLDDLQIPNKIILGRETTRGLGAGAKPEVGEKAAQECRDELERLLTGTDMVFITAGMGKGTGTGASPVIAEIAKKMNILTVGVVTTPFLFEGTAVSQIASEGINKLMKQVDTLIIVPNENLMKLGKTTAFYEALAWSDDILRQGVQGISDIITIRGLINVDFSDVRTIMENRGGALMGMGEAKGENRVSEVVDRAIHSPLLDNVSIRGAMGIIMNIMGGKNLSLYDVNEIATLVKKEADPGVKLIYGLIIDDRMEDEIKLTVLATGFRQARHEMSLPAKEEKQHFMIYREDDIDIPAYKRQPRQDAKAIAVMQSREEDYDIPTFLRKDSGGKFN